MRAPLPHAAWSVALLAALAVGCAEPPLERPRNLVLVSIDTLRAEFLGAYGYDRPTSPHLDALADEGVLFETALSTAPWTLPAHASLLTGLYPTQHGVVTHRDSLAPEIATLASQLAAHGFATAAIVNTYNLDHPFGLTSGFEDFRYVPEDAGRREPSEVERHALEWIDAVEREPFFLFLHFYDAHSDYRSLPEFERALLRPYQGFVDGTTRQIKLRLNSRNSFKPRDRENLLDRYLAGIRQIDAGIGRLLDALRGSGLDRSTLLVVTSDHGEEFLEHGQLLHENTQFEELLRVPLLLRGPGLPKGRRVAEVVSIVDVAPTALSLLGLPLPPGLDGRDLSPLLSESAAGEPGGRLVFARAAPSRQLPEDLAAVRSDRFKLVLDVATGRSTLYDLAEDPGETRDATARHPEIAARLRRALDAHLARSARRPGEAPALRPEQIEHLRALGYGAAEPDPPAPERP